MAFQSSTAPTMLSSSTMIPTEPPASLAAGAGHGGILAEITAGLSAGGDLDALLQRFLDPVVRLAGARAGAVRLLAEGGLEWVSGLGPGSRPCGAARTVDRHCGACGAAASGQPLVWARELAACSPRARADLFGQGCRRLLALPLQHRGRILGVYNLFFADAAPEPGPEVLALLRSVGELLGLALNNARLEQEHLRATLLAERQAMAAEVHDAVAQAVAGLKMRVPLLEDALHAHDEARALQYCGDMRSAATQAHASLRAILTQLRAPMDPLGLQHALAASAERFRRSCGASLEVVNEAPTLRLPQECEAQVFHIVQEALNNVARHAEARHARLHIAASSGQVEVRVEDDGTGLPATASEGGSHYGLQIMGERARRIGGRLEVGPRAGGGTCVRLAFPQPQPEPGAV